MKRLVVLLLFGIAMQSWAVPQLINYQGFLTRSDGTPLDTAMTITFNLYNSEVMGTIPHWTQAVSACSVRAGVFSTLLSIPESAYRDSLWLGIVIEGPPPEELLPRVRLGSVLSAYRVGTVTGASGGTISGTIVITGNLNADTIHTNSGIEFFDGTLQTTAAGAGQQYADTNSYDATRTWVRSMGYLRGGNNIISSTGFVGGGNYNFARGSYSVIAGGGGAVLDSNSASGDWATLCGGSYNSASGDYATIGGGVSNWATAEGATISGGGAHRASGICATIGGGDGNEATADDATVSGGRWNKASSWSSTIGGGLLNGATADHATVGGGSYNYARGQFSVVTGGGGSISADSNSAGGAYSTVCGGTRNLAAGRFSFAGGRRAKANYAGDFVWADSTDANFAATAPNQFLIRAGGGVGIGLTNPGEQLEVNGDVKADTFRIDAGLRFPDGTFQNTTGAGGQQYPDTNTWDATKTWVRSLGYLRGSNNVISSTGFVGGGDNNYARGDYSVIGGGGYSTLEDSNSAIGDWTVIGGGRNNTSTAYYATIGGGLWNTASDYAATVAGGEGNSAGSIRSIVAGGSGNTVTAEAQWAAILGGANNRASGQYSAIGGGAFNVANGDWSVIGGGGGGADSNTADGSWTTIGGGSHNSAAEDYSTVAGGTNNGTYGEGSTVGGGGYNYAYGDYAVIGGGGGSTSSLSNSASGPYSTISGGSNNEAAGSGATVPGGRYCSANGNYSFAAGYHARAIHANSFVWADGQANDYYSDAINSFNVRAFGGVKMYTSAGGGAALPSGATAWVAISDSTKKTDIHPVDTRVVLDKVLLLPIKEWRYKAQPDPNIRHMGPMAQDFWSAFRLGEDSLGISTIDPDGIALAAIQELAKRNETLENRNEKLEAEIALLRTQVQSLMAEMKHAYREK